MEYADLQYIRNTYAEKRREDKRKWKTLVIPDPGAEGETLTFRYREIDPGSQVQKNNRDWQNKIMALGLQIPIEEVEEAITIRNSKTRVKLRRISIDITRLLIVTTIRPPKKPPRTWKNFVHIRRYLETQDTWKS